ncbi:very short patch repair endonuclease [Azotobacter beijerinckii]|uniref:very short patch repair endonuclease n=1 Tax=Azotobacter beijerinckii TaxID=170623 RepID=UPI0029540089|nr:DNA mismatch endonuclease Vsr [Azotobacter beijerinckii]MDV7211282.1 DNA mismatch endonuclease Vsr [Azotobacter beijerinckii]
MDVVDRATRSRMMGNIRGKDTRPEVMVRRFLHAHGYRFRLHRADLPGKPDIVMAGLKTCIFVHGCFWHRHPGCRYATTPKTRATFWQEKFSGNVERDRRTRQALEELDWTVITIWECELRQPDSALNALLEKLHSLKLHTKPSPR